MKYFSDLSFYRFNHLPDCRETSSRKFTNGVLYYAHQGTLRWRIDDEHEFVLEAPVCYWAWPGPHFRYESASSEPWDHYYVSFIGDRIRKWARLGLFPTNTTRPFAYITNPDRFRAMFEELLESLSHNPTKNPEAVHLLEGILLQIHTQPRRQAVNHPRRPQVQDLMDRIGSRPEHVYDLDREAAEMGMTPAHLRRLFRMFSGCSPIAYINRARMRKAASALRTTDIPIKKVAADTGFDDIYYFTKMFSKLHGLPPGRYRRAFQRMGG